MLTSVLPRFSPLAAFIFISSISYASDDCSPVRLDSKGGSMEHVALREQMGGTCFMEVATQMFDAYRFSKGEDIHSSSAGFMAALEMAKSKGKDTLDNGGEGGFVCKAFDYMAKHGALNLDKYIEEYVAPGKNFKHALYGFNQQRKSYLEKMDGAREKFSAEESSSHDLLTKRDNTSVSLSTFTTEYTLRKKNELFNEKYGEEILNYTVSMLLYYAKDLFPDLKYFDFESFFKKLLMEDAHSEVDFIKKIMDLHKIDELMRNKPLVLPPVCETLRYDVTTQNSSIESDFRRIMSRGRKALPVSVNLCSTLYEQGRAFKGGMRTYGTFYDQENCHQHAVILMGRRRNPATNRCQYLVRNSEGQTVSDSVSKDWTSIKSMGALWIDGDKLAEATARIEFLD